MLKLWKRMPRKNYILYTAIVLAGILLDLLTKTLAEAFLIDVDTVVLIPGFLRLRYCENTGIAFGMLAGGGLGRILYMTVSILLVIGVGGYLYLGHAENRWYGVSLSLILSGGIGNMIERIFKGYVVDFISVILYYPGKGGWQTYDFAIFNGADSFVCVGAALLMLLLIIDIVKESRAAKASDHGESGS